jgi:cell cycle checkpoint protein
MDRPQVFSAVSTSVRQLFLILRCISFAPKAEVRITKEGIRFCVDEARVVQGITFLDKALFTSYDLYMEDADETELPAFEISMPALLETLQIFGLQEAGYKSSGGGFSSSATNAFTTPALALAGSCRLSYSEDGAPLSITIIEGPVTTTAELNTYVLANAYGDDGQIPLDRTSLCLKTILPSSFLADAIAELSGTNPDVLLLNVSARSAPFLSLEGLGGSLGDAVVEYLSEAKNEPGLPGNKKQPSVTETFSVTPGPDSHGRLKTKYKFELIKKAGRAMQLASKVSMRQDIQGVLSLQFLVDSIQAIAGNATQAQAGSSNPLFIDYRFLPLVDDEEEDASDNEADDSD